MKMRAENPLMMKLVRAIYHVLVHYRIRLIVTWIPGVSNIIPDRLSRNDMAAARQAMTEWKANTTAPQWTRPTPRDPPLLDHRAREWRGENDDDTAATVNLVDDRDN